MKSLWDKLGVLPQNPRPKFASAPINLDVLLAVSCKNAGASQALSFVVQDILEEAGFFYTYVKSPGDSGFSPTTDRNLLHSIVRDIGVLVFISEKDAGISDSTSLATVQVICEEEEQRFGLAVMLGKALRKKAKAVMLAAHRPPADVLNARPLRLDAAVVIADNVPFELFEPIYVTEPE